MKIFGWICKWLISVKRSDALGFFAIRADASGIFDQHLVETAPNGRIPPNEQEMIEIFEMTRHQAPIISSSSINKRSMTFGWLWPRPLPPPTRLVKNDAITWKTHLEDERVLLDVSRNISGTCWPSIELLTEIGRWIDCCWWPHWRWWRCCRGGHPLNRGRHRRRDYLY